MTLLTEVFPVRAYIIETVKTSQGAWKTAAPTVSEARGVADLSKPKGGGKVMGGKGGAMNFMSGGQR